MTKKLSKKFSIWTFFKQFFVALLKIKRKNRNRKTYCRSLRCWRFFLNAFFTRNIKNAARSMESDVPFSAFSFLSPFSYVFFVVPSFIVWPSGPRTHAPSEFTVCLVLVLGFALDNILLVVDLALPENFPFSLVLCVIFSLFIHLKYVLLER